MGKTNIFTVLVVTILQVVIGYFWYGTHLFGDVVSVGGHGMDFLKTDVLSLLLLVLSSYGLTHIFDTMIKTTGVKDIGGGIKTGLTVGTFAIGLPILTLLNLMGIGKVMLLVVFCHVVLLSVLISLTIIKLKKI
ncbi:MAG: hypothetical protein P4M15_12385 [Alphaproteobacteria bacterium]|nr:hypothetical protein [Alphaproteobacteria bacterium]